MTTLRTKPLHYLSSCGLLLLPIFIWNAAFTRYLPAAWSGAEFWRDIPAVLVRTENAFRLIVSALPFFMPLELSSAIQRRALVVTGIGTGLYFASWLPLMFAPDSIWATSAPGFLAPACTPLVWLLGIALLGQRLYWGHFYHWWMYLIPAGIFMAAHVSHAVLVYLRLN
jgi:hypothetical protein